MKYFQNSCVNSTGVFEEDLLEAMIAYGVGDEEDDSDSDYNVQTSQEK